MVIFSCDGCAEVLKKNQVDVHANRCRKCVSVSCVDCLVVFFGDDYRAHTSCVTEVERYEKRGTAGQKAKKVTPQEQWIELIVLSVDAAPSRLQKYLRIIAGLDNAPRKEKQFNNFASNSLKLRGRNTAIVNEIWAYLQQLREKQKADRASANEAEAVERAAISGKKETTDEAVDKTADQTRNEVQASDAPVQESAAVVDEAEATELDTKVVKRAMKTVLKKASNHTLTKKRLRKAVQEHLGLKREVKKSLKRLVSNNLSDANKKIFVLNGKSVSLQSL